LGELDLRDLWHCGGWSLTRNLSFMAVRLGCVCLALGMEFAGAAFASPTLGRHTQLQLNIVKAHARTRMARDLTVGHSMANTNYHACIVNENYSQMRLFRINLSKYVVTCSFFARLRSQKSQF
jgi:hypothetical protein